jgi:hypothetical protein
MILIGRFTRETNQQEWFENSVAQSLEDPRFESKGKFE